MEHPMRAIPSLLAAAVLLPVAAACGSPPDAESTEAATVEQEAFGEPLTLSEVTPVSAILDAPEDFLGDRVLVEGTVVEVCEMRGCWMDIASDREYEKIQIKVDDGVIVFPLTARGKSALVEGTVEKLELTYEEALEAARHQAEEHGTEFDPSTVTGPVPSASIQYIAQLIT
jgi:hypothetical protein